MLFLDTETVGLNGPVVLIQYAKDDSEKIILWEAWRNPVQETLDLIHYICEQNVVAYNLTFDWFQLNKLYNLFAPVHHKNRIPDPEEIAFISETIPIKYCLKPAGALDLYLYLKKGPFQSAMDRKDIVIKKVPGDLAVRLVKILNQTVQLPDVYFARRKDTELPQWQLKVDEDDPKFTDVILRFRPSLKLKTICSEIFKTKFIDYPIAKKYLPIEYSYDPYSISWKSQINNHILFWQHNKLGRNYAEQDVILLQRLYHHFSEPEHSDNDSLLACAVGAARWRGFAIDLNKIKERVEECNKTIEACKVNVNAHRDVKNYLHAVGSEVQNLSIRDTSKETLALISTWTGPIAERAKSIIETRKAFKRRDILYKLLRCGRFCPDFKIIGTLSGRMSGGSGVNPQGIPKETEYRELFNLADKGFVLSGGDFSAFEMTIADAAYNDYNLRSDLQTGKSLYGLFGAELFDVSHDEIVRSKDLYGPSKGATLGLLYGAQSKKISEVTGVAEEQSESAYRQFIEKYPGVGHARELVFNAFCSLTQPGGIGTEIIWKEPANHIASLLGFRRYFTLENKIVRSLFELAQKPPLALASTEQVKRKDRVQTAQGATQSALYAAAFQIQARNMRAAANHVIQSTGAEITKGLQCHLWNLQPIGICEWKIQTLNIHDEIMCVHTPDMEGPIRSIIHEVVSVYRQTVPLLKLDWKFGMKNWSEK